MINLGFLLREKLDAVLIIPSSWGSQLDGDLHQHTMPHQDSFLAPLPEKKKTSTRGVSHAHSLLCLLFCFYFIFTCIVLSKIQKN
jgi:hypothetical protein